MINWLEKHRTFSIVMVILIAIEIFYFSSLPEISRTGTILLSVWISRGYHFTVFFLFAFFFLAAIIKDKKIKKKHIFLTLIISVIYAISDEIHQLFVPFRDGGIRDVLTDTIGIFMAIIIYLFIRKKTISS